MSTYPRYDPSQGKVPKSHGNPRGHLGHAHPPGPPLGPRHGYALSKVILTNSCEILKVDTGSLHPALHRLERKGWIVAEWKASELGPRLRICRLTKSGRKQLVVERSRWAQLTEAVEGILNAAKQVSES